MTFRSILFTALIAFLLSACNMTLAQDVTPPPGAVQQAQAQPTHSPVFPVQAPDLQNGALIYAEKCAPCHGDTGLGDGPQGQQLPVPVTALGLPEVADQASPADWFLTVTLGNMDNFMPPFNSLSDQQRWDVVAYTQSLSSTPEQISRGESLFNENCGDCPIDFFSDPAQMAGLSTVELVGLLADGGEGIPPLGEALSEDELGAVASYLRTQSFASSQAAGPASATETELPVQAESPSTEGTPVTAEQAEATSEASIVLTGFGPVSGKLVNGSGGEAPSGVTVTLRGFDHSTDENTTPEEVVSQTVGTDANGAFRFEDMDLPEGRIFFVETEYTGIPFQSELAFTEAGVSALEIPALTVYESTTETGALVTEELFVFTEFNPDGTLRVFEQFYISNQSDRVVTVDTDGTSVPILPMPSNAVNAAFQAAEDGASLVGTETGFALPPSAEPYGIIAFYTVPFEKEIDLSLTFAMPVSTISVVVPEGIKVKSDQLTDDGLREMQPGARFQIYSGGNLSTDQELSMNISGKVKTASTTITNENRQTLLVGAGAFGVVLILAGVWMYMRDRGALEKDEFEYNEDDEEEFETAEEVMDAIIALDDLHRAKKIPDEAYQARRAELKERLKELA